MDLCLSFPGAWEDYPFHDDNWTVMRAHNRRTFAFIYERNGRLWANLKCDPNRADFYRSAFPCVLPGYHMNKTHWNSVPLDGSLPQKELLEMLSHSYGLVCQKPGKRRYSP